MRVCLIVWAFMAWLGVGDGAWAATERWEPVSTTAMSITGPVGMFRDHVRFGSGAVVAVAPASRGVPMMIDGRTLAVDVLRVVTPSDPVLLNGNTLCGVGPATWIVAGGTGRDRVLAVYTGAAAPPENTRLCATYHYEVARR